MSESNKHNVNTKNLSSQNLCVDAGFNALILGATGGIGEAMVDEILYQHPLANIYRFARDIKKLKPIIPVGRNKIIDYEWDLHKPALFEESLEQIKKSSNVAKLKFDLVILATGFLHDETHKPEKSYKQVSAANLIRSFEINAVGPIVMLQSLFLKIDLKYSCKIGVLSARVGSISDNRMGGWHSYRASKAALNMLLKNLAIELSRNKSKITLVGLQPGTTDTELSKPFTKRIDVANLQTPKFTAQKLYNVLQNLTPNESGQLFDFNGENFEP